MICIERVDRAERADRVARKNSRQPKHAFTHTHTHGCVQFFISLRQRGAIQGELVKTHRKTGPAPCPSIMWISWPLANTKHLKIKFPPPCPLMRKPGIARMARFRARHIIPVAFLVLTAYSWNLKFVLCKNPPQKKNRNELVRRKP